MHENKVKEDTSSFSLLAKKIISPSGIDAEPFVDLPDFSCFIGHSKENEVIINQQRRQIQKFDYYLNAFDFLNDNQIRGDYFEFGCHRGRTFRMALIAAAFYRLEDMEFHAFDSFQGLPNFGNSLIEQWQPGSLCTSIEEFLHLVKGCQIYPEKIFAHKGFYNDVLTHDKQIELGNRKAALICVDCDFYQSAVDVFKFISPFLQHGTIIYLDDVFAGFKEKNFGGVQSAFDEFSKKSQFEFTPHLSVGWWGRSFIARNVG